MRRMFAGNGRRLVLPGLLLLVAAVWVGSAAAAGLQNGGFETGDTTGWSASGSVAVVSGEAQSGTYSAVLATGSSSPGTGSTLSQTFSVAQGVTIQGWAKWRGGDECGFDFGYVNVGSTTVWSDGNCTSQPGTWVRWSYTAPTAGNYTVTAHVENTSDTIGSSSMGLDSVRAGGAATVGDCWNPLGTDGCKQSARRAVCTKDGFQNVLTSQVTDPTSPYFNATPAAYVEGYGLVCSLTDLVTYGGDPSAYHDAGYKVDQVGSRAADGYTDADFGAWYEYFAKN